MKATIIIASLLSGLLVVSSVKTIFFKANAESGAWFQEVVDAPIKEPSPGPPDPDNPFSTDDDQWHNVSGWLGAEKTNGSGSGRIQRLYNPDTGEYLERHSQQLPSDG